jgi:hypothetical protein
MSKVKGAAKAVRFTTTLLRFSSMGEKTGWTYFEIPSKYASELASGMKKSFRVKGKLDNYSIKGVSLLPMGEGNFIMAFNASMRKGTGKSAGAKISVILEQDTEEYKINKVLMQCINDDPAAFEYFQSLPRSHQNYFSKWVDNAKGIDTKTKRIARVLNALVRKMKYNEMLRSGI